MGGKARAGEAVAFVVGDDQVVLASSAYCFVKIGILSPLAGARAVWTAWVGAWRMLGAARLREGREGQEGEEAEQVFTRSDVLTLSASCLSCA